MLLSPEGHLIAEMGATWWRGKVAMGYPDYTKVSSQICSLTTEKQSFLLSMNATW